MGIHEYDAITLDDDTINMTDGGKQKLKLLLLASKASAPFATAILNLSREEMDDPEAQTLCYTQMELVTNVAGCPRWIWSHFPWMSSPETSIYYTETYKFYFFCLYEFLWSRYHHEFGFPDFDSVRYLSDFDDEATSKKLKFVRTTNIIVECAINGGDRL